MHVFPLPHSLTLLYWSRRNRHFLSAGFTALFLSLNRNTVPIARVMESTSRAHRTVRSFDEDALENQGCKHRRRCWTTRTASVSNAYKRQHRFVTSIPID